MEAPKPFLNRILISGLITGPARFVPADKGQVRKMCMLIVETEDEYWNVHTRSYRTTTDTHLILVVAQERVALFQANPPQNGNWVEAEGKFESRVRNGERSAALVIHQMLGTIQIYNKRPSL